CRRDEHDALGLPGKLLKQLFISARELRHGGCALERLHLAKLRKNDGCANALELVLPEAEIRLPPLLVNGVPFPGEAAEVEIRSGKAQGEESFQVGGLLSRHHVATAGEDHYVVSLDEERQSRCVVSLSGGRDCAQQHP